MNLISGVAIEVLRRTAASKDSHGNAVPGRWMAETVENVLPQPGATSDLEASRPDGVKVAMTFHFPKTYEQALRGCRVKYLEAEYAVIGDPQPYLNANCPGDWNRTVECEVCNG